LRRGAAFTSNDGWRGDVLAPLIRDLGVVLAMNASPSAIRMVLSAQMGKAGPPLNGKDLHVGDFASGILPAAAPLTIGTMTIAGIAMAFAQQREGRVALSFIGEGGSSLGEWHEAINLCAARRLPAIFCVENNQTALSTPVARIRARAAPNLLRAERLRRIHRRTRVSAGFREARRRARTVARTVVRTNRPTPAKSARTQDARQTSCVARSAMGSPVGRRPRKNAQSAASRVPLA